MEERRKPDRNDNSRIPSLRQIQKELEEKLGSIKEHLTPSDNRSPGVLYLEKTIRLAKREIEREIAKDRIGFQYGMEKGKELFDKELERLHRKLKIGAWDYIKKAGFWVLATAPIIYSGILFIAFLDVYITICRYVCFRSCKIADTKRNGYYIFERAYLEFLNFIQMINCAYCSYGNGLMAHVGAILIEVEKRVHLSLAEKNDTRNFVKNARAYTLITVPILYLGIFVFALFDLFVMVYQYTCFRVYKIPIVQRSENFRFNKKELAELNLIQTINYLGISYTGGVIALARKVFAETERYWCPIKHAKKMLGYHDLYDEFAEYGNAEEFFKKYAVARKEREHPTSE